MKKLLPLGLALAAVLTGTQAHAASATWNATPTDGNWAASGGENNWSTGANTYPGSSGTSDTATFVSSSTDTININSASINISGINFGSGSSALSNFTIGTTAGNALILTAAGNITLANGTTSSNVTETVNAPLNLKGSYTLTNANLNSTNVLDFGGAISSGTNTAVGLTLSGSNTGANTISGAITDGTGTVSLTKSGTGVWVLTGSNNYSGGTTLSGGILTVTNTHGLGSNTSAGAITFSNNSVQLNLLNDGTGSTGTIVYGPGSGYNVSTTKSDTINVGASTSTNTGNTIQLGSLSNNNGGLIFTNNNGYNLSFTGTTSIGTNVSFTNNMTSGTVTFAGGILDTDSSASRSITFNGLSTSATTVVAGIAPGSGTNTLSLNQFGPGTLDLTGPSTYNGSTTILGGTVILANSTSTGFATSALTLGGGTLSDIGTSSTAPTIASGTTTISAGANTVSTSATTGHVLALGALSRSNTSGAVVNFVPTSTLTGANGSITTTTGNTNGILGGWATVNGSDWAAVNGTTITAYNNYTAMITSGTGTTSNYQITNGSGTTTLSGTLKIASLKIADTGTTGVLNMGADSLTFNVGDGLLFTGGGSYTINGTAAIGAGTSSGAEFFVNVNNTSTLTINAPVIGSGSGILTKAGAGTLILTATNSAYQQATNIDGGNLQISSLGNSGTASSIGTGSAGAIVLDSGTLTYVGGTTSTNRTFTFNSNGGEIDSSGTGPLSITTSTITPANNSVGGQVTITLGGTNTGANTISSTIANAATITVTGVTKTGAGTWVLSGSNSYTGVTSVNSGTLSVSGSIASGGAVAVNGGTLAVTGTVSSAISVAHGATLGGNGGTLAAVTVAGGGIINTQDGVIGTLNGSTLTLNAGGGNAVLDLDLGGSLTADQLNFSGVASMANDFTVNVNGISGATTGTYTIATASGGGLLASDFASGTVGGTLSSGDTMSFVLSGNSIELVIGTGSVTSNNYYFTGTNSGSFTDAGNYFTAATGGSQQATALSSTSNVFLNANTATNTPDTLNTAASINSLNFVTAGTSLAGSGTLTLAATGTAGITDSAGTAGQTETVAPAVVLGSSQSWASTANSTLNVTGAISGAQSLALTGNGTYKFAGSNTFQGLTVGTGSDTPTLYLTNGTSGSATGTTTLRVNAGATLAGNGTSSGTSFNISGTSTSARANVLVGLTSATDTTVGNILTLKGSTGTSTIADANLTFNLDAKSTASNQLSVGGTNIAFGTDATGSVKFTLNLQNEPAIVANGTMYTLIAGTASTSTSPGSSTGQYAGLTLGTTTSSGGVTETLITGGNLQLAFGSSVDQSYYNGSYLVLYQSSGVDDIDVVVVPEPGTWALMLGGLALLVVVQRARRKNS